MHNFPFPAYGFFNVCYGQGLGDEIGRGRVGDALILTAA